jgi:hypothetical protein
VSQADAVRVVDASRKLEAGLRRAHVQQKVTARPPGEGQDGQERLTLHFSHCSRQRWHRSEPLLSIEARGETEILFAHNTKDPQFYNLNNKTCLQNTMPSRLLDELLFQCSQFSPLYLFRILKSFFLFLIPKFQFPQRSRLLRSAKSLKHEI